MTKRISQTGRSLLQACLSTMLPNRCLMCHQRVNDGGRGICRICLDACIYHTPVCLGCGRGMSVLEPYCGLCMNGSGPGVVAPCSYHQGLGDWIAQMKYQAQFAPLDVLVSALAARVRALQGAGLLRLPQALLPVPLHPRRLRSRGFNQAWLIADALSRLTGIPVVSEGVTREVDTLPQAGLTGRQRRNNLNNAFRLHGEFDYQRIAIIDDVVTTGATATEIAGLFEARHIHVQVWCLARAEAPGLLD